MRMRRFYYLLIGSVFTLFSGCDKENSPDCFKTTGEIIEVETELEPFYSIEVWDEADIYLINSTTQKVIIKAGKNMVPKINLEVREGILTISNDNSCNWIREPGNPSIFIYSNDIQNIKTYDYSNFYSQNTLQLDYLSVFSDGTGNFDLNVNIDTLLIESIYISNFSISGRTRFSNIIFTDDSRFMGKDLVAQYCMIDHRGSNHIEVYPVSELSGALQSTGSIYYYNDPELLDVKVNGTGELVNMAY